MFRRLLPDSLPMTERIVRFHSEFFDHLDDILPAERSVAGMPSSTDFLLHELPRLRDLLAHDYEGSTLAVDGWDDLRLLIQRGTLVESVALYVSATGSEVIVLSVEIQPHQPHG